MRRTHGHTVGAAGTARTTREFNAWCAMRARCFNEKADRYPRYGGRGVTVCERWSSSFSDFLTDVGPAPSTKHSIDRKDNDGHYSCGACDQCVANGWKMNGRWATAQEQANKRSNNRVIEFKGVSMTMAQWARHLNMADSRLQARLDRGWPLHLALDPSAKRRDKMAYDRAVALDRGVATI